VIKEILFPPSTSRARQTRRLQSDRSASDVFMTGARGGEGSLERSRMMKQRAAEERARAPTSQFLEVNSLGPGCVFGAFFIPFLFTCSPRFLTW